MTTRAARAATEPARPNGMPGPARPAVRQVAVVGLSLVLRFIWNLPRNFLILALRAYRRIVSPLYGQVCRFFPSCSAYALEAVTVHGAVRGSWLAVRRLIRCHPWNTGGIDHVPGVRHPHADPERIPYIIKLNHPEKFLAAMSDAEGRPAA